MKNSGFTSLLLGSGAAAQRLRERKAELLEAYVQTAREELEAARGIDRAELVDNVPELLDTLAQALEQGESVANLAECAARFGLKHGQSRARQQAYSLNDVLVEYRLLSQAIFTTLRQLDRLDSQAEDIIRDAIHRGIANSATEFARLRSNAEQAQQQERERTLRERLYSSLMHAPVAIAVLQGPELVYEFTNHLYRDIVGSDRALEGLRLEDGLSELNPGRVALHKRVFATGEAFSSRELPVVLDYDRNGKPYERFWNLLIQPIRNAEGTIEGVLTCASEVTEHIRDRQRIEASERALRVVSDQLRLLADSVPIHLCHLDREERFLFVNKAAAELWRFPIEQFIGKTIRDVAGEEAQRALHPYTLQVLEGRVVSYESDFLAPSGARRTFLNVYIPHRAPDGTIQGFLVAGTDITDRKQAEEALQTSVLGMQEERELREWFVSTLSHDLRIPLTAAKMSSQLLFRGGDDPLRLQKLVGRIADNIDRADQMIRDLLDTNRIKAGEKLSLEIDSCNLNEIAKQTLEELSTIHGDRFVLKARTPIEGHWNCNGIRRLLENLCVNGVKYGAPHRPVTVSLETEGENVRLQVHNEGPPIAADELPNLFEAFRRSKTARASKQRGWGLGLTLVKGFTEAHGGTVSVSSTQERGTLFTVLLPLDARRHVPPGKPPNSG